MTRLGKLLEGIGLTKIETVLFDHLYHFGPDTASSISSVLSINRATCYHGLHLLTSKGLLLSQTKNGSKIFRVSEEDVFSTYFDYQEEKLLSHKNELKEYTLKHRPPKGEKGDSTEIYTGDDGVRLALEKAFKCTSKKWSVIAPKNNYFTAANEEFADYYLQKRKKYKIKSRSLWELPTGKKVPSVVIQKIVADERSPKYLPQEASGTFTSILILYDRSALFISSFKERTAILIHSESVCSLLSMQFETLYALSSKPVIE